MNPGANTHGMEADPLRDRWSKNECFLMSGWRDIPIRETLTKNFDINSTNMMESNEQMNEHMNGQTERRKLYTPRHKCWGV